LLAFGRRKLLDFTNLKGHSAHDICLSKHNVDLLNLLEQKHESLQMEFWNFKALNGWELIQRNVRRESQRNSRRSSAVGSRRSSVCPTPKGPNDGPEGAAAEKVVEEVLISTEVLAQKLERVATLRGEDIDLVGQRHESRSKSKTKSGSKSKPSLRQLSKVPKDVVESITNSISNPITQGLRLSSKDQVTAGAGATSSTKDPESEAVKIKEDTKKRL